LTGSRDLTWESGSRGGEGEGQLTGGVLGLVDEGNIEGEERVDAVVGGGGRDQAGVLSAESSVGFRLFDRDNQVGEEGGIGARRGGGGGRRLGSGGDTFIDRDSGGVVRRRRRVDHSGDGTGGMRRRGRRRNSRGRGASGGAGGGNTDVVDTNSLKRITPLAVGFVHAANRGRGGREDGSRGRDVCLLGNANVVLANSGVGVAAFTVLVSHASQWRRLRRLGGRRGPGSGGVVGGGDRLDVRGARSRRSRLDVR
jgi:hypothetical protein